MSVACIFRALAGAGILFCASLGVPEASVAQTARAAESEVPYVQFTLRNGLRVLVHEDHTIPVVAVSVWYPVGSKDEPPGKTGIAHLFEHLMFVGSEHSDHEWFGSIKELGTVDATGVTDFDYTFYTETVPTPALDRVLWLESDRMGYLSGALAQRKLEAQRNVVQNEKRRSENEDAFSTRQEAAMLACALPAGHPYGHAVIGSFEDLGAISLADVKAWGREYYGAGNAVLVLAGDIDARIAREKAEQFFGELPFQPRRTPLIAEADRLAEPRWDAMYDSALPPKMVRTWVAPRYATREAALLDIVASVLGDGERARLHSRLVEDARVATSVSVENRKLGLTGFFSITVDPLPAIERKRLYEVLDCAIEEFLANGPTPDELANAKASLRARELRGLEKLGGYRMEDRSAALALGALHADDPGFVSKRSGWIADATTDDVRTVALGAMKAGHHQFERLPSSDAETPVAPAARRASSPVVGAAPAFVFPAVEEARLPNGMKIVLARRPSARVVEIALEFAAGVGEEAAIDVPAGTAAFTGEMLREEARARAGAGRAGTLDSLGATLSSRSSAHATGLYLSVPREGLAASLAILGDVVRNPEFDAAHLEDLRARRRASLEQEYSQPQRLAMRVLSRAVHFPDHEGTVRSLESLSREQLARFRGTWLRPDGAKLFVVSEARMADIRPMLARAFADWKASGTSPPPKVALPRAQPGKARVVLIDKPNASQSVILAGHLVPAPTSPRAPELEVMNEVLGVGTASRLNANLREEKGWLYFVSSSLSPTRESQLFSIYAPVQADRTADSIREILRELREYGTTRPMTAQELERTARSRSRRIPGLFQTSEAVLLGLTESARFGLPWNHPQTLPARYRALDVGMMKAGAQADLHPEQLVWVVVGDLGLIEADIRALELGPVSTLDAGEL